MKKFAAIFAAAVLVITLAACADGIHTADGGDNSAFTTGIQNF